MWGVPKFRQTSGGRRRDPDLRAPRASVLRRRLLVLMTDEGVTGHAFLGTSSKEARCHLQRITSRRCFAGTRQDFFYLLACIFLSVQFTGCTAGDINEPSVIAAFGQ